MGWCDGRGCGRLGEVGAEGGAEEGRKEEGQADYGGGGGQGHCDCGCGCDKSIRDEGILVGVSSSQRARAKTY